MPSDGGACLAIFTGKEVTEEHAQWRRSDTQDKIDTQARMGSEASFVSGGG